MAYTIEIDDDGVVIHGPIPVIDITAIARLAKLHGFEKLDAGVAQALDASMVLTDDDGSSRMRKRIAEKNANMDPLVQWLYGTDTGLSSRAIFAHMTGHVTANPASPSGGFAHPLDPDDFGRCFRLLEKFPEWRLRIREMASVSYEWSRLASEWDELERLWKLESLGDRSPMLYAKMQELIGQGGAT